MKNPFLPFVACAAMSLSSVSVIANTLRLRNLPLEGVRVRRLPALGVSFPDPVEQFGLPVHGRL